LAKQQTRQRLIAAAKQLIAERGYEAATLRDIAAGADMSTGAVFANFEDKADLFNEVIIDDLADLLVQLRRVAAEPGSVAESLFNTLSTGYALHLGRLSLVQAQMGFAWACDRSLEQRRRAGLSSVLEALGDILRAGIVAGELSTSMDIELVAEMAWDAYVASYRHAIFDGWALEALQAHLARRIEVLLGGYRVREREDTPSSWRRSANEATAPWFPRTDERTPRVLRG
jgi:AcrR family transcriptional regulator